MRLNASLFSADVGRDWIFSHASTSKTSWFRNSSTHFLAVNFPGFSFDTQLRIFFNFSASWGATTPAVSVSSLNLLIISLICNRQKGCPDCSRHQRQFCHPSFRLPLARGNEMPHPGDNIQSILSPKRDVRNNSYLPAGLGFGIGYVRMPSSQTPNSVR